MKYFKIILILFINSYYCKANTFNSDSLKNKYELNDPRNPNCPCHKYQKLADEEFKKLNKNNNPATQNSAEGEFSSSSNASISNTIKTKPFKSITKLHHKNKTYKIFSFNKRRWCKKRNFFKNSTHISSCFHWR